jgi:hypothetical protein
MNKAQLLRGFTQSAMVLSTLLCMAGLVSSAFAQGASKRYPLTTEMIVAAMQGRQLPTEGVQVRLSAPMTSSSASPMLEIQAMTPIGQHGAQLRVACRTRGECLPFYVSVSWPEGAVEVRVPASLARQGSRAKNEVAPLTADSSSASIHQVAVHQVDGRATDQEPSIKIRAGTPAMLLIEDHKVHISLKVVYLEGGEAGDKVRVASLDHKQAYKAEIVSPTLLKGSF